MEADKNPFPEITVCQPLQRLETAARFIADILTHRHAETPQRGATAVLDAHLDEQMVLWDDTVA